MLGLLAGKAGCAIIAQSRSARGAGFAEPPWAQIELWITLWAISANDAKKRFKCCQDF